MTKLRLIPVLLTAAACARTAAPAASVVMSANNGISCAVDYSTLHSENLRGIALYDRGIGGAEKIRHLNELNAMPAAFLGVMRTSISINLTAGSITEFPRFYSYRGVTPRGWEGSGHTWDDIPGAGTKGALYLGDSARANDAMSLAVHEATHSVDYARGLRRAKDFLSAYNAERNSPHPDDLQPTYRLNNPEEYLAMAVEEYYCNADTKAKLLQMYPRAYDFVETKLPRLLGGR